MHHPEGPEENDVSIQRIDETGLERRSILKLGALAAGVLVLHPMEALARGYVTRRVRLKTLPGGSKPEEIPQGPIDLPAWKYGSSSTATDTVLMFRGDPSHQFYGTGAVPD
ncbi:MAG: hypothetical protein CMH54_09720 [Myxococcales bacterium]|nr:hypothetical protein [Myxococcales bacterium]|tara:strand:- start:48 stop:380 length:333 start_codon:yes stop_codon:yes gene_type:complete